MKKIRWRLTFEECAIVPEVVAFVSNACRRLLIATWPPLLEPPPEIESNKKKQQLKLVNNESKGILLNSPTLSSRDMGTPFKDFSGIFLSLFVPLLCLSSLFWVEFEVEVFVDVTVFDFEARAEVSSSARWIWKKTQYSLLQKVFYKF